MATSSHIAHGQGNNKQKPIGRLLAPLFLHGYTSACTWKSCCYSTANRTIFDFNELVMNWPHKLRHCIVKWPIFQMEHQQNWRFFWSYTYEDLWPWFANGNLQICSHGNQFLAKQSAKPKHIPEFEWMCRNQAWKKKKQNALFSSSEFVKRQLHFFIPDMSIVLVMLEMFVANQSCSWRKFE